MALILAIVPAIPFLLFLLCRLVIASMVWLLHRFPPPRPVFCNSFVDDDRTLLPYWVGPETVVDRFGHWAWVDYRDNVLLVVAIGVPEWARSGSLCRRGLSEYTVKAGPDREDRFVTLKRSTNALVVVLPDGTHRQFALAPGLAKQFHQAPQPRQGANVLRAAGQLLEPDEKAEFDRFLADYREPKPR